MQHLEHLACFDKVWIVLRRHNFWYNLNKIASALIAFGFALLTLSYKRDFYAYQNAYPDAENISSYAFIYWLLFIYFSFSGLDTLIELYAVYAQREKGALGLLFEMNYFLGFGIAIYICIFCGQDMAMITDPLYSGLYDFIKWQTYLFYGSIAASVFLCGCFYSINKNATRQEGSSESKEGFVAAE